MLTDPIADMLTRIRNANKAMHDRVEMPNSRMKQEIARLLKDEGYIKDYRVVEGTPENGRAVGSPRLCIAGFARDRLLRGFMYELMALVAPHLDRDLIDRAAQYSTQAEVDSLCAAIELPRRP